MGTEVHYKNSFPGYYSMRNINEDSNNNNWHIFYGENALTNGHYYEGFTPRIVTDTHSDHDKDELKQRMLQHEAIFKNQVYELHRLYRRQRDIMEEVKRKDIYKHQISIDTSSSSSLVPLQKPFEDAHKWQIPSFPLGNSTSAKALIFGAELSNSPLSCSKGNGSKDCEVVECRPSKVRKKLFDPEEGEQIMDNQASEISSYKENGFVPKNEVKSFLDDGGKKDSYNKDTCFMSSNGLIDLNEPIQEASVDYFRQSAKSMEVKHLKIESNVNGYMRGPGNSRSNINYMFNGKEGQRRGAYSEISSQIQDLTRFNQNPMLFGNPSGYPFVNNTPDMQYSWSPSGPSWGKSNDSLTRKLTTFQTHPSFVASPRNGFYHGSSSGSKELMGRLPSGGFDYRNCSKLNDGSRKIFKGSNFVDLTDSTKGLMDLNTVQTLSSEEDDDNSRKRNQTVLPWLKAKNDGKNGDVSKVKDDSLSNNNNNNNKLSGFPIFGNFCEVSKNEASSVVSTSTSMEHRGIDINVTWDDVTDNENIDKLIEKREETDGENKNLKNHFDLNSCVTEDDEDLVVTESVKSTKRKMTMEIDLEAPAVSESEEEIIACGEERKETEELVKLAAEAIIAISINEEENHDDNEKLLWFVDVIENNMGSVTREIDEYETLTLELEETKEKDYMPTPLVPEFQEPEEVGPVLTSSRPRRGQARRGRPRRDFQRDILPGITSLSRHEITEDLQVFGGLMKATGHSWNFGSARKNGKRLGARGRRNVKVVEETPAVVSLPSPPPPPANVEVVGLDERSLTGWGKTTRRPRRQRCAVGNSVAVQLT